MVSSTSKEEMENMKMKKSVLAVTSLAMLLGLAACNGDPNYPRKFTVTFDTGKTGAEIASQSVKEGYLLNATKEITNPTNTAAHYLFKGWYEEIVVKKGQKDEKIVERDFDVINHRVIHDMTLKARWIFPTSTPSHFTITEDAFSNTVTWIQTGAEDTSKIKIEVIQAIRTPNYIEDPILGGQIQDPDNPYIYEYKEDKKELADGVVTYDKDNYTVTFKRNKSYGGSKYKFYIYNDGELVGQFADIQFKGSGTQEDPYLVYNENDLKYLTTNDIPQGTYVEMKNNITLHSLYSEKRGKVFDGILRGNGYSITLKNNSGVFYKLGQNARVDNLVFRGAISSTEPSIGVVANYNDGYITNVENASVSVLSTGGVVNDIKSLAKGGVGGIVGTNLEHGEICDVKVSGNSGNIISGRIGVGGVAGVNYGKIHTILDAFDSIIGAYNGKEASSTINNSYAGTVVGANYGEIYGIKSEGKINCRRVENGKEGNGATNVGGIAGYNAESGSIKNCIWEGMRCVGDTNVGGIVGLNEGLIQNCMTGRRLRKPSNTLIEERQFISPVIGSHNVGGIAGKITNTSRIINVLSTANVWAYESQPWTIAERADNAVGVKHNFQKRVSESYLGRTYGQVINNSLTAPTAGQNVEIIDNGDLVEYRLTYKLGHKYEIGANGAVTSVKDQTLVDHYLDAKLLGSGFYYNSTYGITVRLPDPIKK
jgi:hypothetical protein